MIHLRNVQKVYPPDQRALAGIDLRVFPGDFVFVAGASGAGKSSLLKLLYGAEMATTGEVVVGGRNLQSIYHNNVALLRRDIGVIFQDYKLLPRRSVLDNVALSLEVRGVGYEERSDIAIRILKTVGLADRASSPPLTLSGGEQQRVAIARALIHKPRLILADEPTGNLDSEMTRVVFDLLVQANVSGVTILVATHNLSIIEELNRRTVVLDRGKIIGDFKGRRKLD